MLDLSAKYRPKDLSEVYGQKFPVSFLKNCVKAPMQFPHVYFITGPAGCGKTTLTRAFQASLASQLKCDVEYHEIDSTDSIMESAEYVRMLCTSAVVGYRIITLDECHKISSQVQAELLKLLEDNITDEVFVFLLTNVPGGVSEALKSRLVPLELKLFSVDECQRYIQSICEKEGLSLKPETIMTLAISSMGCLRSCVMFLMMVIAQGEDSYTSMYATLWSSLEKYFTDFTINDTEVCQPLFSYHPEQLKSFMSVYFREFILMQTGKYHEHPFPVKAHAKLFQQWCKLLGAVKSESDFPSFLVVYRGVLSQFYKAFLLQSA